MATFYGENKREDVIVIRLQSITLLLFIVPAFVLFMEFQTRHFARGYVSGIMQTLSVLRLLMAHTTQISRHDYMCFLIAGGCGITYALDNI